MKLFLIFALLSLPLSARNKITILHTNDLHSFLRGSLVKEDTQVYRKGGHSKMAFLVKSIRSNLKARGEEVLLFDAGDFFSGTLFHSIAIDPLLPYFPEYEFFDYLNYDAITLGNHEFDGGDNGFELMMRKVKTLGSSVPIVSTNLVTNDRYPIKKSLLLKLESGIKVGVLGALGPDGCSVSKGNRTTNHFIGYDDKKSKEKWRELYKLLKGEATKLRKEGADLIVLILHGGTGEDDKLAKKVSELDVIIAGHTHEVYQKKIKNVVISQAGSYAQTLGVLPLELHDGNVNLRLIDDSDPLISDYHLHLDGNSQKDHSYEEKMNFYERSIEDILVKNKLPKVSYTSTKDFSKAELGAEFTERIKQELIKEEEGLAFYFTTLGLIRRPLYSGHTYTTSDLFNILPIGFHDGNKLGSKVVSFYLTKDDLYQLVEFLNTYSRFSSKATPVFPKSVHIEYRKWGIPFINRVKKIEVDSKEVGRLIKVSTNTFIYSYLDLIKNKTMGLIKIIPRNRKGDEVKVPTYHQSEIFYLMNSFSR